MDDATIPVPVYDTTTERLLAIAEIIEAGDSRWDQDTWSEVSDKLDWDDERPEANDINIVSTTHSCGAYGCIAGWGVAMSPPELFATTDNILDPWTTAGTEALGVSRNLADFLFEGSLGNDLQVADRCERVGRMLRYIASFNEGDRDGTLIDACKHILNGGEI